MQATVFSPRQQAERKCVNPYSGDPEYVSYIHESHRCGDCRNIHLPGTRCAMQPQTATQVLPQVSDAKTLKVCQHTRPQVAIHSQSQTPVQRLPKHLTKCLYYAGEGCRYGGSCQFLHPL